MSGEQIGYRPRTCARCGADFKPSAPNQKFCAACSDYRRKLGRRGIEQIRVCPVCGRKFDRHGKTRKVCSPECAKIRQAESARAYLARHRDEVNARARAKYAEKMGDAVRKVGRPKAGNPSVRTYAERPYTPPPPPKKTVRTCIECGRPFAGTWFDSLCPACRANA